MNAILPAELPDLALLGAQAAGDHDVDHHAQVAAAAEGLRA